MKILDLYDRFWQELRDCNLSESAVQLLIKATKKKIQDPSQGDFDRWHDAYQKLPDISGVRVVNNHNEITCEARISHNELEQLAASYQKLIPWRKGPFNMFSINIDAEWQSHLKWRRLVASLPSLTGKSILDVGCGNGYYLMRMSEYRPRLLMGIDPGILQTMQFWSIEKYRQSGACVLPISMENMPDSINYFDVVFSMGVLYHRKSPIHHIKDLYDSMRPNGFLILETLIVDGDEQTCLIPHGRYAQMRNVWFLPSVDHLSIMLKRNGFDHIQCVDVTTTTITEQRSTDWMRFHSLKDFLSPDQTKTVEGYDLPKRAIIIAQKTR